MRDCLGFVRIRNIVGIKMRDGRLIPLENGVVALEDSEGYTRYDRSNNIIEILASEKTYRHLELRHPRAAYFVAHELRSYFKTLRKTIMKQAI